MVTKGTTPPISTTQESDLAHVLQVAQSAARRAGAAPHEVDEVAQRTAIKLWHRWDEATVRVVRSGSTFRWNAYISQTARNVHRDLIRSNQRRRHRGTVAANLRPTLTAHRPGTIKPPPETSDGLITYLARQHILDAIETLPSNQRTVASLILIAELSTGEAAQLLGIQPQSVRKHLRAAKLALIAQI